MQDFVKEGEVLAGKYRVESTLGHGGMGIVVAALHLQLGQRVALKFLLPAILAHPESVARFLREARALAQIQSEHVARIMDVGTLEWGTPYMVMELLHGADLHSILATRGPLAIEDAIDYVLQACEAIAEAHARGIVHRDVKPANLFLTHRPDGSPLVKVLDFGISKTPPSDWVGGLGPSMTATDAMMGSPRYMSPEQLRSAKDVDPRADIWSLGIVLYELLTAKAPYPAEAPWELAAMIMAGPPAPLRSVRPDMPSSVEAVIVRCLQTDRARRFTSVAELARALAKGRSAAMRASAERTSKILRASAVGANVVAGAATPAVGMAPSSLDGQHESERVATAPPWARGAPYASRARETIAVGLVAVVAAAAVGGGAWWVRASRTAPVPSAPASSSMPIEVAGSETPAVTTVAPAAELVPADATDAAVSMAAPEPAAYASASAHPPTTEAQPTRRPKQPAAATRPTPGGSPKPPSTATSNVFDRRKW